ALESTVRHKGSPWLGLAARAQVRGAAGQDDAGNGALAARARLAGAAVDAKLALVIALAAGAADIVTYARAAFGDGAAEHGLNRPAQALGVARRHFVAEQSRMQPRLEQ